MSGRLREGEIWADRERYKDMERGMRIRWMLIRVQSTPRSDST